MKLTKTIEEEYASIEETVIQLKKLPQYSDEIITYFKTWETETAIELQEIFRSISRYHQEEILPRVYSYFENVSEELSYKAEDITHFCFALEQKQHVKWFEFTGVFISTLISKLQKIESIEKLEEQNKIDNKKITNNEKDTEYFLVTNHLKKKMDALGCNNSGRIKIIGDCGNNAGFFMQKGTLHIEGNVDNYLGAYMQGGEIFVTGKSGSDVGKYMKMGNIYVAGNCKRKIL